MYFFQEYITQGFQNQKRKEKQRDFSIHSIGRWCTITILVMRHKYYGLIYHFGYIDLKHN
jgi:hypothetical protein